MNKPSIFIGYRRADSADAAGRIFDQLEGAFGRDRVFKDVDSMPLGVDFRSFVAGVIEKSHIFLLLIGPRWLDEAAGRRSRLWDTDDLVRIEIETALRTKRVLIIPTLVSGAQMPARDALPSSIQPIVNLNAAIVRQDPDFRKDMRKLIAHLESLPSGDVEKRSATERPLPPVEARPKGEVLATRPRVAVIGVGGAGGNAVDNMVAAGLRGVEFVAVNTDATALNASLASTKLLIGQRLVQGLGSSARPEIGEAAARESIKEIEEIVDKYDLIFLTAGMGGGTGSGASPLIAEVAKGRRRTIVGIFTAPFAFEGNRRMRVAGRAIGESAQHLDAIVTVQNQKLFRIASKETTFKEAFQMADQVLFSAIRSVMDIAVSPGIVNVDFEDLTGFLHGFGHAKIGFARGRTGSQAEKTVREALVFALMDDTKTEGATKAILNISGGSALTLSQLDQMAQLVRQSIPIDTKMLIGSSLDSTLGQDISVALWINGSPPFNPAQ